MDATQNATCRKVIQAALSMQRYSWEQGVLLQALLELGETEWVLAMAVEALNRQTDDGRAAVIGFLKSSTDPCSAGEALLFAYRQTGLDVFLQGVNRLLAWAMKAAPRNPKGIVYHVDNTKEFWADSFFMLPPFLAAMGQYEEACRQMDGYWETLFHPDAGLLSHKWDDGNRQFKREAFWGSGNGWATAGMARALALLPENNYSKQKQILTDRIKTVLDASLRYQRTDGLFHDIIDDSASFVETNYAQMLAYAIYRCIAGGWLSSEYLADAEAMYAAAVQKIDEFGFIHGVCGAPTFQAPGISPEGQAFYLFMEAARRKT